MSAEGDATLPPAQQLCVSCGLCCGGAWFGHINLLAHEAAPARAGGFTVDASTGTDQARLPCHLLQGGRCTAYATWRPSACASYRCQVLIDFEAQRLTFEEAASHVAAAKALAARVRAAAADAPKGLVGITVLRQLDSQARADLGNAERAAAALDAMALTVYYDRHFRTADER